MTRICPSCGGDAWEPFYRSHGGTVLTADQRIAVGTLDKAICASCGLVGNARPLADAELQALYGESYQLNTYGGEEHLFYTADGPVPRSQVIFDWFASVLPPQARRIVEIGCGEGNVLQRFKARGGLETIGIEGSRHAVELARTKGLNVIEGLILSSDQTLPEADFLFCYGVLEHVEDLDTFLGVLRRSCRPGGRVAFGLPIQDEGGYDLFFAEHVRHFAVGQVTRVLERHGLRVETVRTRHPVNRNAALFCCEAAEPFSPPPSPDEFAAWRALQTTNRDVWLAVFAKVDAILRQAASRRLAVYGSGEMFSLLRCYTSLGNANIVACLDEDPGKIGSHKHGLPVHHPSFLDQGSVDTVLLTTNPRYHAQIRAKLAGMPVTVVSAFD